MLYYQYDFMSTSRVDIIREAGYKCLHCYS